MGRKRITAERPLPAEARRIRDLRADHDLTQQEVADRLHIAQRTYADYELGNIRLSVECLVALAELYNVDMNYISGLTGTPDVFPKN